MNAPAATTAIDLTVDPASMTPQERIAIVNETRRRIMANEPVSDDELRYGHRLLCAERKLSSARTGAKKAKAKEAKPVQPTLGLADF